MNAASGAGSRVTWCSRSNRMYPPFLDRPVVFLDRCVVRLGCEEHEIGKLPGATSIPIDERMDTNSLGVNGNTEHARSPVRRVFLPPADRVEAGTQFDRDLLGRHTKIQFPGAQAPSPGSDISIEHAVKVAQKVISEQIVETERAIDDLLDERVTHLDEDRLLIVVQFGFRRVLAKRCTRGRCQRIKTLRVNRRPAVARSLTHLVVC